MRHLILISLILLEWSLARASLVNIGNAISLGLRSVNLCCDFNQLNTQNSCVSPKEGNLLDSMRKLYGHKLNCESEFIQDIQVNTTNDPKSNQWLFVDPESRRLFMSGRVSYPGDSYCVHRIDLPDVLSLLICSPGCSAVSPCYKKCCGWRSSAICRNESGCQCKTFEHSNFSQLFDSKNSNVAFSSSKWVSNGIHSFTGSSGTWPDFFSLDFWISADGVLKFKYHGAYSVISIVDYCVDELFNENGSTSELAAFFCHSDYLKFRWADDVLHLTYLLISSLFLGAAVVVFFIIRSDHSIHEWTQFAFLISAFLCEFSLAIVGSVLLYEVAADTEFPDSTWSTIELGSNFFIFGLMMNVLNMNAHLFWTILKLKPERKLSNWKHLRILAVSEVVSWSFAAVFTFILESGNAERYQFTYAVIVFTILGLALLLAAGTAFLLLKRLSHSVRISCTFDSFNRSPARNAYNARIAYNAHMHE